MKTFIKQRIMPWLLAAAMIVSLTGMPVYAGEESDLGEFTAESPADEDQDLFSDAYEAAPLSDGSAVLPSFQNEEGGEYMSQVQPRATGYYIQKNPVKCNVSFEFTINGETSTSGYVQPGDLVKVKITVLSEYSGFKYNRVEIRSGYGATAGENLNESVGFAEVPGEEMTWTFTAPLNPATFLVVNVIADEIQPEFVVTLTSTATTMEYDYNNVGFPVKVVDSANGNKEIKDGVVQYYLNGEAVGDPVKYEPSYYREDGFYKGFPSAPSGKNPYLRMGLNTVKAVYRSQKDKMAESNEVSVTITKRDIGELFSVSRAGTGESTYNGTDGKSPAGSGRVGFGLPDPNQYTLTQDDVEITGTKDGEAYTFPHWNRSTSWVEVGLKDAGVYKITASLKDSVANYMGKKTTTFTIKKANPAITISAHYNEMAGDTVVLKAEIAGVNGEKPTGTIQFKNGTTDLGGPISVTDGTAECTVNSVQLDNKEITAIFTPAQDLIGSNYNSAQVTSKIQEKLQITPVTDKKYNNAPFTLETTGGSGTGAVTFSVPENNVVLSLNGDQATIIGAGKVKVRAVKAGDTVYYSTSTETEIEIGKAPAPEITFPHAADLTYGRKLSDSTFIDPDITYGTFSWANGNIVPEVENTGYDVIFLPSDHTKKNYEVITNKTHKVGVTVSKSEPEIKLSSSKVAEDEDGKRTVTLEAEVVKVDEGQIPTGTVTFKEGQDTLGTSELTGTGSSQGSAAAVFKWENVPLGIHNITAVYSGSKNYKEAKAKVSIDARKELSISIEEISEKTYGDAPFELSVKGNEGTGGVTFTSSDSEILSISGTTAQIHKAGNVTISVSAAPDDKYLPASATKMITIAKKPLTLKADDKIMAKGQELPEFTYTAEGLVYSDKVTDAPQMTTAAGPDSEIGTYAITLTGGTVINNDSYEITRQAGTLHIRQGYTVTFEGNGGSRTEPLSNVPSDTTITKPEDPTRSGYTFQGWYKDNRLTIPWYFAQDPVTQDLTLYAKWKWNSTGDVWPTPPAAVKIGRGDVDVTDTPYGGGISLKPGVSVTGDGKALAEGKDYELVLSGDCVSVTDPEDTLTARLYLKNGYVADTASWPAGTVGKDEQGEYLVLNWRIVPKNMADTAIIVQNGKILVMNGEMVVPNTEYHIKDNGDGTFTISAAQDSKNYTGSQTIEAEDVDPFIIRGEADRNLIRVTVEEPVEGAEAYDYVLCKSEEDFQALNFFKSNKNAEGTASQFLFVRSGNYKIYARAVYRDENGRKTYSRWSQPAEVVIATDTPNAPTVKKVWVKGRNVTVSYTVGARTQGVDVMLGRAVRQLEQETRPVNYNAKTGLIKNIKGTVRTVTFKNVSKGTYYAGVHPYILSKDGLKYFGRWSKQNALTEITVK